MPAIKLAFNAAVYSSFELGETIQRIARLGYEGIEISASSPHAYPKHVSPARRRETKAMLQDRGLTLAGMAPIPGFGPGFNPGSAIPEERQDTAEHYKEVIQLCSDWGGKLVVFFPGWPVFGTLQRDAWTWSQEVLANIARTAADRGVTIAVTPMPARLVESAEDAIRLLEEVRAPNVKLSLDTFHALNRHDGLITCVERMGPNLAHVRVGDQEPLGVGRSGRGDFVSLVATLEANGFDGYVTLGFGARGNFEPDRLARDGRQYVSSLKATTAR